MSDGLHQLGCANCGSRTGLEEVVEIEATGTRSAKAYANPDGSVKVVYGMVESDLNDDVTDVQAIECADCGEEFGSWEEATANKVYEYRCAECGWWGLQDWLHTEACTGELEKVKHPSLGAAA